MATRLTVNETPAPNATTQLPYWLARITNDCWYCERSPSVRSSPAERIRQLVLTTATTRSRPEGVARWDTARTPHQEFLSYAN